MRFVKLLVLFTLSGCSAEPVTRSESPIVQEIFETVQPEIEQSSLPYKIQLSPDERNRIAQTLFLRPVGQERQDMAVKQKFEPYSNKLYPLFKKLGDIDPVQPSKTKYDYILINGATVDDMRKRVKTLVNLVTSKTITVTPETTIVFLSGDRELFSADKEGDLNDTTLLGINAAFKQSVSPKTEYEAAIWIWQQADLPGSLRNALIQFINAPKIKTTDKSGQVRLSRPNTASTIKTWLESDPQPGTCLCISSQPFVYYQMLTTVKLLNTRHNEFQVDGTGELSRSNENDFSAHVDIFMDNLARTIYTEAQQTSRQ